MYKQVSLPHLLTTAIRQRQRQGIFTTPTSSLRVKLNREKIRNFLADLCRRTNPQQDGTLAICRDYVTSMFLALTLVASAVTDSTVQYLCQDSFYNWLTPEQSKVAFENKYDFDHPNAIDLQLFAEAGSRFVRALWQSSFLVTN